MNASFVANRQFDEARRFAEGSVGLGDWNVHERRDPAGAEGEAFLQVDQRFDCVGAGRIFEHQEIGAIGLERLADAAAERVQHDAAAESARVGFVADDEAVARKSDDGIFRDELREAGGLGSDRAGVIEDDCARDGFRRADEEPHAGVVLECALGGGANFEPCVETRGGGVHALVGEDVAAGEVEFFGAGEIERDALA